MQAASSPVQQARAQLRHDLRNLTYVTLDEANGGIVRNLSHTGLAVQAVAALRPQQQVRLRFELRYPRLRVEGHGEVMWANSTGQCGIRFLDVSPQTARRIDEWIFGNLLESIPHLSAQGRLAGGTVSGFSTTTAEIRDEDGLLVSPGPLQKVIQLQPPIAEEDRLEEDPLLQEATFAEVEMHSGLETSLDEWLSQHLSARELAWAVDALVMVAGFLLFSIVFLGVTHELPKWPLSLAVALAAAAFVPGFYLGFFHIFGGPSLGTRMARLAAPEMQEVEEVEREDRFR
jgi:hypothetical protein